MRLGHLPEVAPEMLCLTQRIVTTRGKLLHARATAHLASRVWRLAPGAWRLAPRASRVPISPIVCDESTVLRWAATQLTSRPYGIVTNKQGAMCLTQRQPRRQAEPSWLVASIYRSPRAGCTTHPGYPLLLDARSVVASQPREKDAPRLVADEEEVERWAVSNHVAPKRSASAP